MLLVTVGEMAHFYTWVEVGSVWPGETAGHARIPIGHRLEPSQVVVCLVGYWSTGTANWPPSYQEALEEEREGLGTVLLRLNADDERYYRTVQFTRELLADPNFISLRDAIARALNRVPRLERETIERLAEIYIDPIEEGALCPS